MLRVIFELYTIRVVVFGCGKTVSHYFWRLLFIILCIYKYVLKML